MLQLTMAHALAARVPGLIIEGFDLPLWGISAPLSRPVGLGAPRFTSSLFDADFVGRLMRLGMLPDLQMHSYAMRSEFFGPPDNLRTLFAPRADDPPGVGADTLLIHIRTGDIVTTSANKFYGLLPPDFYRYLIRETRLKPVFIGELGDHPYVRLLKQRFPEADFLPDRGVRGDFQVIRSSRHVVMSPSSTYVWMAVWLSETVQTAHMPLLGQFHPAKQGHANLLPVHDPRFRFYDFPDDGWFADRTLFGNMDFTVKTSRMKPDVVALMIDARRRQDRPRWRHQARRLLALALKERTRSMFRG